MRTVRFHQYGEPATCCTWKSAAGPAPTPAASVSPCMPAG